MTIYFNKDLSSNSDNSTETPTKHNLLADRSAANSHPITAITNLNDIIVQSYVDWINGKFEFVSTPPSFNESGLTRYPVSFLATNNTDNPVVTVNGKDYPLFVADRALLAYRIAPQEQCFLWFRPNACYVSGLDPLRASIDTGLAGIDQNEYMTPYVTRAIINQIVAKATSETYTSSKAYVDSLIKDYETVNLYLNSNGTMNTVEPIGTGTIIEKILTTSEQLIYSFSYAIPTDGFISPNNLYILSLFFNSISTNRITYIRAEYTVNDVEIFNTLSSLNNTRSEFELYRQVLAEIKSDLYYENGHIAKLNIYGRLDTGSDRVELILGKKDNASALYRNAPIDPVFPNTFKADKITTAYHPVTVDGGYITQEFFNAEVNRIFAQVFSEISLLKNK